MYRVKRTCDAEACRFLDDTKNGRWLVFKVGEFTSIATSKDGSYSVISGMTIAGRPFTFKAAWWTDDKATAMMVNCSPFVKKYLDNHTPNEQYRPVHYFRTGIRRRGRHRLEIDRHVRAQGSELWRA